MVAMSFALAMLFALHWLGGMLARVCHLPVPGGLVGMLLLVAVLLGLRRVPLGLQRISQVLLPHLMLLFIPLIAGVALQGGQLRAQWLPFVAACVLGAVVALVVTAWTLRWMLARTQAGAARGP